MRCIYNTACPSTSGAGASAIQQESRAFTRQEGEPQRVADCLPEQPAQGYCYLSPGWLGSNKWLAHQRTGLEEREGERSPCGQPERRGIPSAKYEESMTTVSARWENTSSVGGCAIFLASYRKKRPKKLPGSCNPLVRQGENFWAGSLGLAHISMQGALGKPPKRGCRGLNPLHPLLEFQEVVKTRGSGGNHFPRWGLGRSPK